ncbi:MAG: hydroxymethylglutaryl-CoA synthase [Thermoprotei archaeon]|nr:hydroxymethylglutaryl-CoA synthase [Thermoprotei archaeon]
MPQQRPETATGIHGWGVYIPRFRIKMEDIAREWGWSDSQWKALAMIEKAIAGPDEDSTTMGLEAAANAMKRAGVDPGDVGAVFFGTESKPYAVKPSATIIAEALGVTPVTMASDLEFACRAASEGLRASLGLVASGMVKYAIIIGSDTAQANPGDVLEFTASSGAAAYVVGPSPGSAAVFEGSYSYVTDTPDFWRREGTPYPRHGEGFTGEPAYFAHIIGAARGLMNTLGLKPSDFKYAVFHQPNGRFPLKVGEMLGFKPEQLKAGIVTPLIGNTYNASALIGLARILDNAAPGDRILVAPFGSGAGSDAYSIIVTDAVEEKRNKAPKVDELVSKKIMINYSTYAKFRHMIRVVRE